MRIFLFILIFIAGNAYALPCPNGGGILYKGDTIAEVLQQCGEPQNKETTTKVLSSSDEWVYYKGHAFDAGSTQMVVLFNNNRVSNIRITERYPYFLCQQGIVQISGNLITTQTSCGDWTTYTTFTNFCGWGFGVNDAQSYVESICGRPANQANLQSQTLQETQFYYGGSNPQTIIFRDGKVVDFQ